MKFLRDLAATFVLGASGLLCSPTCVFADPAGLVRLESSPDAGLQPEVVVAGDTVHLLTFAGDPARGDLVYRRRLPGAGDAAPSWSTPVRVNSSPGSAVAMGTVRGGHMAVAAGVVHVAWMSSDMEAPGMFYARSDGAGFSPQVNVTSHETGLDGGGSLAADDAGNVYVAWHAGHDGEPKRRLFVATSRDTGRTFAAETRANPLEVGACGCCGMRAGAGPDGDLWIVYRAAIKSVHRDMQLLSSSDGGRTFAQRTIGPWELAACPMSTAAIAPGADGAVLAWETDGQIHWSMSSAMDGRTVDGDGGRRKHPAAAMDASGRLAIAWAEGTGWNRGGDLAWQVYGADGATLDSGRLQGGVPKWSRPAIASRPGGGFLLLH